MGNWSGQLDVRDVSAWLQEPQVELKVGVGGSFRAFSSAVALWVVLPSRWASLFSRLESSTLAEQHLTCNVVGKVAIPAASGPLRITLTVIAGTDNIRFYPIIWCVGSA